MPIAVDALVTIQDLIRWGTSRFRTAGLYFGHGTDNAIDEVTWLVAWSLHLPLPLPEQFYPCRITAAERADILTLLQRRISERRPAAYLTGQAWFAGLEWSVDERVIIPRSPLAEVIENHFAPWVETTPITRVLDLCTGSGCMGLAAAVYMPTISVDLVDISSAALQVAADNVHRLTQQHPDLPARVRLVASDLFANLDGQQYDVILSNPPYVSAGDMATLPAEYHHEPHIALVAGDSGLEVVLRILRQAATYLRDDGVLFVEVGASAAALTARYPQVPFTWLECERGGEGVFMLYKSQLVDYHQFLL